MCIINQPKARAVEVVFDWLDTLNKVYNEPAWLMCLNKDKGKDCIFLQQWYDIPTHQPWFGT